MVAAGLAGLLAFAPTALAREPALDEYTLDLPGVRTGGELEAGVLPAARGTSDLPSPQGIAGENEPPTNPLDAATSVIVAAPLGLALAIFAALAGSLLVAARQRAVRLR